LSRYLDLLKQIPPGKEEIHEDLLKQLNSAAWSIMRSRAGQYDLTEEDRQNYDISYNDYDPDACSTPGRWGLLDKWPLRLGELVILKSEETEFWYLGINSGSNPNLMLKCGSKSEIFEEMERLTEFRKTSEEEIFENEIMHLVDNYRDEREKHVRSRKYRS